MILGRSWRKSPCYVSKRSHLQIGDFPLTGLITMGYHLALPPRTLHAKYSKSSHNRTLVPGFGFGIYDLFTMGPRRSTPRRLLILLLSLDGASHGLCLSSSIGKPRLARAPEPEAAGRMCPALGPLPHAAHLKSPKAQHKDFMGLKLGNDKMPHESCCNVWWSGRPISEQ